MDKIKRRLLILGVWIAFIAIAGMAIKYFFIPKAEKEKQTAQQQAEKRVLEATSSDKRFDQYITLNLDGFSGYAVFRSQEFKNQLGSFNIGLYLKDDGANYDDRIAALDSGDADIAIIPIDSFLTGCNRLGKTPATIVAIVDETVGADAVVGYKDKYPKKVDSLNSSSTKFVCSKNSPSEFLTKVIRANFDLSKVPMTFVETNGAEEVFKIWRNAKPQDDYAYVVWQPFVAKMLENPNMHVIIDSSKFRGYIVDAVVVNRDFLVKKPEQVKTFLECYFRALYEIKPKMADMVRTDAVNSNSSLSEKQASELVDGIWWKNTQENYAHMGLRAGSSVMHIEDMINQINIVLAKTDSNYKDPSSGQLENIYYKKILQEMRDSGFQPSITEEDVRGVKELKVLSDAEWKTLVPVGTLQVPKISFARGTANLTSSSESVLDNLVENLNTWPTYYVSVCGSAFESGAANEAKAKERTQVVVDYLVSKGINTARVKANDKVKFDGSSVSFVLGQLPY